MGLSHETGQVTHHIAPDIDAERDKIVADLQRAGQVASLGREQGIWPRTQGYNGGGDPYRTDGMMAVVVLSSTSQPVKAADVPGEELTMREGRDMNLMCRLPVASRSERNESRHAGRH